jgi:uncharacterized protein involved in type VI secretion and phage assembly
MSRYGESGQRVGGVVIGTVKRVNDPRGEGRVLVQFPWMDGRNQSYWAPVATMLSGKGAGTWFMPEKDDEVLVAFDRGKVNHPYIVGFLWNGVDKPPETKAQHRVIRTPGGNILRFEDTDGATRVVVRSKGDHELLLDDGAASGITLKTKGGLSVTLSDMGASIELKGGGRSLKLSNGRVEIT